MKKKQLILGIGMVGIGASSGLVISASVNTQPKQPIHFNDNSQASTLDERNVIDPIGSFSTSEAQNFLRRNNSLKTLGNKPFIETKGNYTIKYEGKSLSSTKDQWDTNKGSGDNVLMSNGQKLFDWAEKSSTDWGINWRKAGSDGVDEDQGHWRVALKFSKTDEGGNVEYDNLYIYGYRGRGSDGKDEDFGLVAISNGKKTLTGQVELFGAPLDMSQLKGNGWAINNDHTILGKHDRDSYGDDNWKSQMISGLDTPMRNGDYYSGNLENELKNIALQAIKKKANNRVYLKATSISKDTLKEALGVMFSPLKNSTQQKDLTRGSSYWVDGKNPPTLHIGLDNDIFKAYEDKKWIREVAQSQVQNNGELSKDQKIQVVKLLNEYKINKENYDKVIKELEDGNNDVVDTLSIPSWAFFNSPSAPKVEGKGIVDWLSTQAKLETSDRGYYTNYDLLSHFLNSGDTTILLHYTRDGKPLSVPRQIVSNNLYDIPIILKNSNTSNFEAKISNISLDFEYKDNSNEKNVGHLEEIKGITPTSFEDMKKYFIDWDNKTKVYSAYYQPNQKPIGTDIRFTPQGVDGEGIYYDHELAICKDGLPKDNPYVRKDGNKQKAYTSIFYKVSAKEKIAFVMPPTPTGVAPIGWDWQDKDGKLLHTQLDQWKSTSGTSGGQVQTLGEYLKTNGLVFDWKNVIFNIKNDIILTINPYTDHDTSADGTTYVTHSAYEVKNVYDDLGDGKRIVLLNRDGSLLSSEFNKGFGMDRQGIPSMDGFLGEGQHSISIGLKNYPLGDNQNFNFNIDKTPPQMEYETTNSLGGDKYFYKDKNGEYQNLELSTTIVEAHLRDNGVKKVTLSFVDSQGNWYNKELEIKGYMEDGKWIEEVLKDLDYQGLFKITYEDINGNTNCDYVWEQKPTKEEGNPLIAQMKIKEDEKASLLGSATIGGDEYLWVKENGISTFNVSNLLNDNLIIERKDVNGKWVVATNEEATSTTKYQVVSSVGTTMASNKEAHSLVGDEIKPLIKDGVEGWSIDTNPSSTLGKYKEASIEVKKGGEYRIKVESNIYKENNGIYTPYSQTLNIIKNNEYKPVFETEEGVWEETHYSQTNEFDISTTTLDNGEVDKEYIAKNYDPTKNEKIGRVGVGASIDFVKEFIDIDSLSIEYSPLWYEWWGDVKSNTYSNGKITFTDEGRYKISFKDKNGNIQNYNILVFDWPKRDFSKYFISKDIEDQDGKKVTIHEEFYNSMAIATTMEEDDYKISGEMERDIASPLEDIYNNLQVETEGYIYNNIRGSKWLADKPLGNYAKDQQELKELLAEARQKMEDEASKTDGKQASLKKGSTQGLLNWLRRASWGNLEAKYLYEEYERLTTEIEVISQTLGGLDIPSWVKISPTENVRVVKDGDGADVAQRQFIFEGSGESTKDLGVKLVSGQALVKYKVDGDVWSPHYPSVDKALKAEIVKDSFKVIEEGKVAKDNYFLGTYIDLYESSGERDGMLVDNDDDPSTPKVHLLEDKDHYQQELKEWIDNGGNKDGFFTEKENRLMGTHNGDGHGSGNHWDEHGQPSTPKVEGSDKKEGSGSGALIGALIGGFLGSLMVILGIVFFIRKRKTLGFEKTKEFSAKGKRNKKNVVSPSLEGAKVAEAKKVELAKPKAKASRKSQIKDTFNKKRKGISSTFKSKKGGGK